MDCSLGPSASGRARTCRKSSQRFGEQNAATQASRDCGNFEVHHSPACLVPSYCCFGEQFPTLGAIVQAKLISEACLDPIRSGGTLGSAPKERLFSVVNRDINVPHCVVACIPSYSCRSSSFASRHWIWRRYNHWQHVASSRDRKGPGFRPPHAVSKIWFAVNFDRGESGLSLELLKSWRLPKPCGKLLSDENCAG